MKPCLSHNVPESGQFTSTLVFLRAECRGAGGGALTRRRRPVSGAAQQTLAALLTGPQKASSRGCGLGLQGLA